jgi:hypothetical protein
MHPRSGDRVMYLICARRSDERVLPMAGFLRVKSARALQTRTAGRTDLAVIMRLHRDYPSLTGVRRIGKIHCRKPVCKVSQHINRRCADQLRASSANDGKGR